MFSVYDPPAVARAFALTLLLNDAPDRSRIPPRPRVKEYMFKLARQNPDALVGAALLLSELGPAAALERARARDADTVRVIDSLLTNEHDLKLLLDRNKTALVEAAENVVQTMQERPNQLSRLIEFEGYLAPDELGEYLDERLTAPAR